MIEPSAQEKEANRRRKRMKKNIWERMNSIMYFMCIILGFMVLAQIVISAPTVNPYDSYDINTYNCLDIATETQDWYLFNGINTTVYIGCFNDTLCHAWLEDEDGNKIIGYVSEWSYEYIYVFFRR